MGYFLHVIFLLCPALFASAETSQQDKSSTISTLRWASTGGGWRSQFACVGFANLFSTQLDIMSKFSAISTTSGASWFSTQLFYSQQFYDRVINAKDSQALYDFVVQWMDAYGQMLTDVIEMSTSSTVAPIEEVCNTTGLGDLVGTDDEVLYDVCRTLVYFDGDWAACEYDNFGICVHIHHLCKILTFILL